MEPTTKQLEEHITARLQPIYTRLKIMDSFFSDFQDLQEQVELLKQNNLPTPKRELTYIQSRVLELYLEGKKGKDIAYDINRSRGDVSVILKKLRKWKFCK